MDPLIARLLNEEPIAPEQAKRALLVRLVNPPPLGLVRSEAAPIGSVPFRICASGSVPPNGQSLSFEGLVYGPEGTWNFPATVWEGVEFWITDLQFQSKMVRHPDRPQDHRSSYAVFQSIMTLTEHNPFCSYRSPIRLPAGFNITGFWINQSAEHQNMIAAMHGYVVPTE